MDNSKFIKNLLEHTGFIELDCIYLGEISSYSISNAIKLINSLLESNRITSLEDQKFEEFLKLMCNANPCFWFGLPPCPKCNKEHGDSKCDKHIDLLYRKIYFLQLENNLLKKNNNAPIG